MTATSAAAAEPRCLAAALQYLERGWSALCLCPPDHEGCSTYHTAICQSPGKVPIAQWREFQRRLPTETELAEVFGRHPNANVGVALGAVSGIVGIDIDGYEGEEILWQIAGGADRIPRTLAFSTGRDDSYRLLFALPREFDPQIRHESTQHGRTLTFLCRGSQTVMPPSLHAEGSQYTWWEGRGPHDGQLLQAPEWLIRHLRHCSDGNYTTSPHNRHVTAGSQISQGERNLTLFRLACASRRHGCTEEEILALLHSVNLRCQPPVSDREITTIARSAASYPPALVPSENQASNATPATGLVQKIAEVIEEEVQWLWPSWFPLKALASFSGDGGVGKSTVLLDLAARITTAREMPDGTRPTAWQGPRNVLWIYGEDDPATALKPRFRVAGGDEQRLYIMEQIRDTATGQPVPFKLPDHFTTLANIVREVRPALIVFDPILTFFSRGDSNKETDVRETLSPLRTLAMEFECSVVICRHLNKNTLQAKAQYRTGGNVAFENFCRASAMVGKHPTLPNTKAICFVKGNYAPPEESILFETRNGNGHNEDDDGIPHIVYTGTSNLTADELVAGSSESADERASCEEAEDFIVAYLREHGPTPATQLMTETQQATGLSEKTVAKAKKRANVRSRQHNVDGRRVSYWYLPNQLAEAEPGVASNSDSDAENAT